MTTIGCVSPLFNKGSGKRRTPPSPTARGGFCLAEQRAVWCNSPSGQQIAKSRGGISYRRRSRIATVNRGVFCGRRTLLFAASSPPRLFSPSPSLPLLLGNLRTIGLLSLIWRRWGAIRRCRQPARLFEMRGRQRLEEPCIIPCCYRV